MIDFTSDMSNHDRSFRRLSHRRRMPKDNSVIVVSTVLFPPSEHDHMVIKLDEVTGMKVSKHDLHERSIEVQLEGDTSLDICTNLCRFATLMSAFGVEDDDWSLTNRHQMLVDEILAEPSKLYYKYEVASLPEEVLDELKRISDLPSGMSPVDRP